MVYYAPGAFWNSIHHDNKPDRCYIEESTYGGEVVKRCKLLNGHEGRHRF